MATDEVDEAMLEFERFDKVLGIFLCIASVIAAVAVAVIVLT